MQRSSPLLMSLIAALATGVSMQANAADAIVEFFNSNFIPESVEIATGSTVRWQRIAGTHTVTSGRPDGATGTPDEPGALFDVELDADNSVFEFTFNEFREGGYFFFDRTNPDQVGFVRVTRGETVLRVAVVDNVFNPEIATVFEGDTVRWEHEPMEDFHTVTSGLSSRPEDNPGALFDEESSDALPIFAYLFEDPGEYPYFCRPHETMGMKGTIIVQKRFLRGDSNSDAQVDISDAVLTLLVLFSGEPEPTCVDASDANDDGKIDIADPTFILNFLFLDGGTIPAPFPLAGPDRSEDTLLCL